MTLTGGINVSPAQAVSGAPSAIANVSASLAQKTATTSTQTTTQAASKPKTAAQEQSEALADIIAKTNVTIAQRLADQNLQDDQRYWQKSKTEMQALLMKVQASNANAQMMASAIGQAFSVLGGLASKMAGGLAGGGGAGGQAASTQAWGNAGAQEA